MKNLWNTFISSEWGLFIAIVLISFFSLVIYNVVTPVGHTYNEPDIIVLPETGSYDTSLDGDGSLYPSVAWMQGNDSIMGIHAFWGITMIYDSDWEESANALGVPTNCLTIDMYMDHMQHGARSRYLKNKSSR